jgi:hypothetical protein
VKTRKIKTSKRLDNLAENTPNHVLGRESNDCITAVSVIDAQTPMQAIERAVNAGFALAEKNPGSDVFVVKQETGDGPDLFFFVGADERQVARRILTAKN